MSLVGGRPVGLGNDIVTTWGGGPICRDIDVAMDKYLLTYSMQHSPS